MTKQEFTDRTGYTPTDQEFARIHSTYMTTILDKDEFCKDWKKHAESAIIESLHVVAVNRELRLEQLERERFAMVDFLLREAQAFGDAALKNKAIEMVGHAEVIRRLFELRLDLWPGDKDYIVNNLPK